MSPRAVWSARFQVSQGCVVRSYFKKQTTIKLKTNKQTNKNLIKQKKNLGTKDAWEKAYMTLCICIRYHSFDGVFFPRLLAKKNLTFQTQ